MRTVTRLILVLPFSIFCLNVFAQAPSSDLALNHNRLLREKTADGVYKQVGNFKVVGSPYIYDEKNKGDLFSTEAKAYNVSLSYNTYNQELEFFSSSNPDKPLVKLPGEVDSFIIHSKIEIGLTAPVKFVYGSTIGSTEKSYFQVVYAGPKYSVYKRYKAELGYVSTNYIQSELRQFDMIFDYYYADIKKKTVKKLKSNHSNVIKEFKGIKDVSGIVTNDAFSKNPDNALAKIFEYLNN